MPAQWTADVIGKMYVNGITAKQLASELGVHPKYLSAVLNSKREPDGAEVKIKAALDKMVAAITSNP